MSKEFWNYELNTPWKVVRVEPDFPLLHVRFADETTCTVDMRNAMATHSAFAVLADKNTFNRVGIANGIITYPWGLDIASDALYEESKGSTGVIRI